MVHPILILIESTSKLRNTNHAAARNHIPKRESCLFGIRLPSADSQL